MGRGWGKEADQVGRGQMRLDIAGHREEVSDRFQTGPCFDVTYIFKGQSSIWRLNKLANEPLK